MSIEKRHKNAVMSNTKKSPPETAFIVYDSGNKPYGFYATKELAEKRIEWLELSERRLFYYREIEYRFKY